MVNLKQQLTKNGIHNKRKIRKERTKRKLRLLKRISTQKRRLFGSISMRRIWILLSAFSIRVGLPRLNIMKILTILFLHHWME